MGDARNDLVFPSTTVFTDDTVDAKVPLGESFTLELGDNAGATRFGILDSDLVEVWGVDSNGIVTSTGGLFLPDDVALGFGNTAAAPDATIDWDTSLAPDSLLIQADSGEIVLQTTTSGDIKMSPAGVFDLNGQVDQDVAFPDTLSGIGRGYDAVYAVANTANSTASMRAIDYQLNKSDSFNLTTMIGINAQVSTSAAAGVLSNLFASNYNLSNTGAGTVSNGTAVNIIAANTGGGTYTNFIGLSFDRSDATTVAAMNFDPDFVSGESAIVCESGVANLRYFPLSHAATGITFDSAALVLATTTSGSITLSPATTNDAIVMTSFIDADYTYSAPVSGFPSWDFVTNFTVALATTTHSMEVVVNHTGADGSTGEINGGSFVSNKTGTLTDSLHLGVISEINNTSTGTITDGVGYRALHTNSGGGTFTNYYGMRLETPASTNVFAFDFEGTYVTGGTGVRVADDTVLRYLPLSTASDGVTFSSTDLILATTTSGDIQINAADVVISTVSMDANSEFGWTINAATTGDFNGGGGLNVKATSDGMVTPGFFFGSKIEVLGDVTDAAGSVLVGEGILNANATASPGDLFGLLVDFSGALGTKPTNTGGISVANFFGASSVGANVTGVGVSVGMDTVAGTELVGGAITITPDIAAITNAYGLTIENDGSQTADTMLRLEGGAFTIGIDLSNGTTTTALETGAGTINATSNDLALQTTTSGDITMTPFSNVKMLSGVFQGFKGGDLSSANDMAVPAGNYADVTGTTQINTMAATILQAGTVVTLQFDGTVTVKQATAGTGAQFQLAAAGDFSATANDTLTVVYDGTYWRELARTAI